MVHNSRSVQKGFFSLVIVFHTTFVKLAGSLTAGRPLEVVRDTAAFVMTLLDAVNVLRVENVSVNMADHHVVVHRELVETQRPTKQ